MVIFAVVDVVVIVSSFAVTSVLVAVLVTVIAVLLPWVVVEPLTSPPPIDSTRPTTR